MKHYHQARLSFKKVIFKEYILDSDLVRLTGLKFAWCGGNFLLKFVLIVCTIPNMILICILYQKSLYPALNTGF